MDTKKDAVDFLTEQARKLEVECAEGCDPNAVEVNDAAIMEAWKRVEHAKAIQKERLIIKMKAIGHADCEICCKMIEPEEHYYLFDKVKKKGYVCVCEGCFSKLNEFLKQFTAGDLMKIREVLALNEFDINKIQKFIL